MAITVKELMDDLKQAAPAGMSEAAWIRILTKLVNEINAKVDT